MASSGLRALTIRQPYAWQIMTGTKTIEYRSWRTEYRGMMLIHASGKVRLKRADAARWPAADTYSVILGFVVLDRIEGEPGTYEWHLRDPRPLPSPIPCVGRLNLWEPPGQVLNAIPDLAAILAVAPPTRVTLAGKAPAKAPSKTSDELLADFIARRQAERAAPARKPSRKDRRKR